MSGEALTSRQQKILDEIKNHKFITVQDLCKKHIVSHSTIRRDLKVLEEMGKINSFHGGVAIRDDGYGSFFEREFKYSKEKRKIGEYAVKLVNDGDTIYIGGGTTTYEFAKALSKLTSLNNISVITSAFNIARFFLNKDNFKVIIPGGELIDENESMTSNITIQILKTLNFNKAFIGCYGITAEQGLMWPDFALSELKKFIVEHAKETIVLADKSKIGSISTISCNTDKINMLVTNTGADENELKKIVSKGIKVIKT